jgi:hypothetical protein
MTALVSRHTSIGVQVAELTQAVGLEHWVLTPVVQTPKPAEENSSKHSTYTS